MPLSFTICAKVLHLFIGRELGDAEIKWDCFAAHASAGTDGRSGSTELSGLDFTVPDSLVTAVSR